MTIQYENFYDRWLHLWDESEKERKQARCVIHDEELEWVETPQDYRIALMAGPENGFRTWGTEITIADIPSGHHTGKHEHGEEGIFIVEGEGYSVVNGMRYDWKKGSVLWMPFGSQHQHFNTGLETARYLSFTALNLEHFAGLGRVDQREVKGFSDLPVDAEVSADGLDKLGRRIRVFMEDSPILEHDPEEIGKGGAMLDTPIAADHSGPDLPTGDHRDYGRAYMRSAGEARERERWANTEIEISNMMGDRPGRHGGKHAHMEAFLYIIDGEGYTVVDGVRTDWRKGSLLHVQGPQTQHQHFNSGDKPTMQLRMVPGFRMRFFQPIARERFPKLIWGGRGDTEVTETAGHSRSPSDAQSYAEGESHRH